MIYPSEKADIVEGYVRKTFHLSPHEQNVYASLRWLEKDKLGFLKPVCVGYRDIVKEAGIGIKKIKKGLLGLQSRGLIKLEIGSSIKTEKKSTSIQRVSLDGIKMMTTQGVHSCHLLAQALNARSFLFNGKSVTPLWSVAKTGRVISSKPNIQGQPVSDRISGLQSGMKDGEVLVDSDIKAADPSLIKFLLEIPPDRDLYADYMKATGVDKTTAKKRINTLAYSRDLLGCFGHMPKPAQEVLSDYVSALDAYRTKLLADARSRRGIATLTGRFMQASPGARLHAGTVLCWRVQGSVADIINAACLRLLDIAAVVIPVHDAILALLPAGKAGIVAESIRNEALKIGIRVAVKESVYSALTRLSCGTGDTTTPPSK